MLYLHFPEKSFDINACPFFAVLGFNAVTRRQKRSKNIDFLLHVGKPLFHCVQGHRIVSVRRIYDCRITFPEAAIWRLNKIQTSEKILSLRITFSYHSEGQFIIRDLNIQSWFEISSVGSNDTPPVGKIRNHTLREDQELGQVFLLFDKISSNLILASPSTVMIRKYVP